MLFRIFSKKLLEVYRFYTGAVGQLMIVVGKWTCSVSNSRALNFMHN
jgi:hypothetical protein